MKSETRQDSRLFSAVVRSLLKDGIAVRFRAHGRSMYPAIGDGQVVQVEADDVVRGGEVALVETADGLRVHRVVVGEQLRTRGDCCLELDMEPGIIGGVAVVEGAMIRRVARERIGSVVRRWVARALVRFRD